jgi:2-polyprenyl-3-methyl-5-hydroxy-6-metoxy-1,4-benzoquinol methylase
MERSMKLKGIDNEQEFDWSRTSTDYSIHRTGYPKSLFEVLAALGVGLRGQRIRDLGTGTGALARAFARSGAKVTAIDISASQISAARKLAEQEHLDIEFFAGAAENVDFDDCSFEVVTSGQAWIYFNSALVIPKYCGYSCAMAILL